MRQKNFTFLFNVKKVMAIIIISILFILGCFVFLQSQSHRKTTEDKTMIDVFGRQRMLTQMISKDASRLYNLIQVQSTGTNYHSDDVIISKISNTKQSLLQARQEFSQTLYSMHEGYLVYEGHQVNISKTVQKSRSVLEHIDQVWHHFDRSIEVLVSTSETNIDVANALIYINDNNLLLLDLSEQVLETALEDSIASSNRIEIIIYVLIIALCLVIIASLYYLFQYIVKPFKQLYQGIADIGLHEASTDVGIPTKQEIMPMVIEVNYMFKKINKLISLIENMNNTFTFTEMLNFINQTFSLFIPYNYIGVALIDHNREKIKAAYGVSDGSIIGLPDNVMGQTVPLNETSLEKLILSGEARIINDLEAYTKNKQKKQYNEIILEAGIRASITLPLKVGEEPVGVIFFSSNRKNVYNEEHVRFLKMLVNSIAVNFNQNIFINDLIYSSTLALAKLAEARDEDTGEHLDRMKYYTRAIAEFLYNEGVYKDELTHEFIDMIERFSPLHDIGKVGIPDGILLKPGKLTPEEFETMKKHTIYGGEVLRTAEEHIAKRGKSLFKIGIEIAEGHQEKWDGSGYPYGKKGLEIPLSARIVAVADVFDALTSKRPYKEAFPFEQSFEMVVKGGGSHFDPNIIECLRKNKQKIYEIYSRNER